MFSKQFDRRVHIALGVLAFSGLIGMAFGAHVLWPSNLEAGYAPSQPFEFNHKVHAGDLKIDCLYCHTNATKGAGATVPSLRICMNCHAEVKPKDKQGKIKEGVQILLDHWERKEPIVWGKVSDLADFAYFDHSRHVNSGVECQECHGPVEKMVNMKREFGMKMSWCLDCHKQERDYKEELFPSADLGVLLVPKTRAPIQCSTCHR